MPWVTVQYTKGQVDAAGQVLANLDSSAEAIDSALEVVNNWRAAHSFPLNTFQTGLRRRAREVYKGALVAQRLKRASSIEEKLRRFPGMKLSRMQDIGGCRAVVTSVLRVRQLEHAIKSSRMKHVRKDVKDYIREPKVSGYRGIHLIYRYMSDKSTAYNGLLVEMQLRTRLQHAWATAVETVGTFLQEALKSSQGPEEWLQFFAVAGSAFACLEHTPLGPGVSGSPFDITAELRERADKLGVEKTLRAYSQALRVTRDAEVRDLHYFILNLAPPQDLQIIAYTKNLCLPKTPSVPASTRQFAWNGNTRSARSAIEPGRARPAATTSVSSRPEGDNLRQPIACLPIASGRAFVMMM